MNAEAIQSPESGSEWCLVGRMNILSLLLS